MQLDFQPKSPTGSGSDVDRGSEAEEGEAGAAIKEEPQKTKPEKKQRKKPVCRNQPRKRGRRGWGCRHTQKKGRKQTSSPNDRGSNNK